MKIFISHQQRDSLAAASIAKRLQDIHSVQYYLDLIDNDASQTGELLGDHIKRQLSSCTQLMAVVSANTKESWWVPWEIGIATEKDYPISTYAAGNCDLPSYLKKWPYLKSEADLDIYVKISRSAERELAVKQSYLTESVAKSMATKAFHQSLRRALGQ